MSPIYLHTVRRRQHQMPADYRTAAQVLEVSAAVPKHAQVHLPRHRTVRDLTAANDAAASSAAPAHCRRRCGQRTADPLLLGPPVSHVQCGRRSRSDVRMRSGGCWRSGCCCRWDRRPTVRRRSHRFVGSPFVPLVRATLVGDGRIVATDLIADREAGRFEAALVQRPMIQVSRMQFEARDQYCHGNQMQPAIIGMHICCKMCIFMNLKCAYNSVKTPSGTIKITINPNSPLRAVRDPFPYTPTVKCWHFMDVTS